MIAGRLERHYAWAQDPAQLAEVAGHALTALGCTATTVRAVTDLLGNSGALSRLEQTYPGRAGQPPSGQDQNHLSAHDRDLLLTSIEALGPAVDEVLARLSALSIRPEIFALSPPAIRALVRRLDELANTPEWVARAPGVEDQLDYVAGVDLFGPKADATAGEVSQIVAVFKAMPRSTQKKLSPVTNSLALRPIVAALLADLQVGDQVPPTGLGPAAATGSGTTRIIRTAPPDAAFDDPAFDDRAEWTATPRGGNHGGSRAHERRARSRRRGRWASRAVVTIACLHLFFALMAVPRLARSAWWLSGQRLWRVDQPMSWTLVVLVVALCLLVWRQHRDPDQQVGWVALGVSALSCLVIAGIIGVEHLWWPRWYRPVAAYTTYDLSLPTVVMAAMLLPGALWVGLTCHRHVVSRRSEG